jgi:hypothetical protein
VRGVALTLAAFAFLAVLLAWSRWLSRHRLAALGHLVMAVLAAVVAALLSVTASGLEGYEPLRPGVAAAELRFDATAPGRWRATLVRLPAGAIQVFELPGDRWRITARTIAWRGLAADAGLKPVYRLTRLESGAATPAAAPTAGASFGLGRTQGPELWDRLRAIPALGQLAIGAQVEGPWQPMSAGVRYSIQVTSAAVRVEALQGDGDALGPTGR